MSNNREFIARQAICDFNLILILVSFPKREFLLFLENLIRRWDEESYLAQAPRINDYLEVLSLKEKLL